MLVSIFQRHFPALYPMEMAYDIETFFPFSIVIFICNKYLDVILSLL